MRDIGTRKESSLHHDLKLHYAGQGGVTEVAVGSFICDACTADGEIIEIQRGSFASLRKKAAALTPQRRLRVIYPVVMEKYIETYEDSGKLRSRRRSPRRGSDFDLFNVLIRAPELALKPKLTIELALVTIVERRLDDGQGSWKRRKISITDRLLETREDGLVLARRRDYHRFVPFKRGEHFTSAILASKEHINRHLARKALYVLRALNMIHLTGKQGRSNDYTRAF